MLFIYDILMYEEGGCMKKLGYILIGFIAIFIGNFHVFAEDVAVDTIAKEGSIDKQAPPSISYASHIQNIGWQEYVKEGISGTSGKGLRLESFKIDLKQAPIDSSIHYKSFVMGETWQNSVSNNTASGTIGRGKPITAITVELTGSIASEYDIYYRVHSSYLGWLDWAKNGEKAGTVGHFRQIEAIQVKLVKKGSTAPGNTQKAFLERDLTAVYKAHVQDYGWMNEKSSGMVGTTGKGKRVEAFSAYLTDASLKGELVYKSFVSGEGWQNDTYEHGTSGTTGKGKPITAIHMYLTSELANVYDIYYRVHSSYFGWMGWAKNGENAGSIGYDRQIESIEIKIVKKGNPAPGNTQGAYKELEPTLTYRAHIQNDGWLPNKNSGVTGTTGQGKQMEAFYLSLNDTPFSGNIQFRSYINATGWQDFKTNGISGTTGIGKGIEAINIRLTGELANHYDVYYRVHSAYLDWLDWAKNGENAGSIGFNRNIEAFEIKLVKKGKPAPGNTTNKFVRNENYLTYTSYSAKENWQNPVYQNTTSGKTKVGHKIEAIKINIADQNLSGSVSYEAHVENIGWQGAVSNGAIAGTTSKNLRIEAIRMNLTKELNTKYDIYYRSYIENYGWLDWAKNGEISGSIGLGRRLEAYQVVLINKGDAAPGSNDLTYIQYGFRTINGNTYFYDNSGNKVTGFKVILGTKYYFNNQGILLGSNVKKVIDVSSYQGSIDFKKVKNDGVDAVILRVGYGTNNVFDKPTLDYKFPTYLRDVKNNNIPYGLYFYSYAVDEVSAKIEADYVIRQIQNYGANPSYPIFYDLEENKYTTNVSKEKYDAIIKTFINTLANAGYHNVKIYTYKYMAENRLSAYAREKLTWIAQYANKCTYKGSYKGWQFTDSARVNGINGNVDMSIWFP